MTSNKRTLEAVMGSDDDEGLSLGRQTLPVARLSADFNGEPMDGMQYLFMVRRAAEKLPFVTRAAVPHKTTEPILVNPAPEPNAHITTTTKGNLPSEEWRQCFVQRFKNFRKNMSQPTIGVQLPSRISSNNSRAMPGWTERDNWWSFINGRPDYEWDPPKRPRKKRRVWDAATGRYSRPDDVDQYEVSYAEMQEANIDYGGENPTQVETLVISEFAQVAEAGEFEEADIKEESNEATLLPTPHASPEPEVRYKTAKHRSPTMALIKDMDNRYALKLLQFFAHWINRYLDSSDIPQLPQTQITSLYITQNHARWIFALLSRVDDRLLGDELNELRNLSRACIRYLKDLKKNEITGQAENLEVKARSPWVGDRGDAPMDESACWVVIAAIAEFWGQKDMWMDAEIALR